MNSLQELNGYGNASTTYTDSRPAGIRFDRVNPTNQTVTINQHDTHSVYTGIEIVEVIRPTDCTPTYTINVSTITGATVSWATVPSGCTVTNPSTGVYTISGVNSKAIWDIVRSPTISLAVSYVGSGSYTATITYNSTQTKAWTTALTVIDITNMDAADDFYFLGGVSGLITGNPIVIDNYPTTWDVTVTPSTASLITSLSTAGSGGTSSFNATTKVLSISGTKTQVNSHLNSITYVIPSTTKEDFTFEYAAVNVTLTEGDTKTQNMYTTEYLSATRASETYLTNTLAAITNGPLVTDATYSGTGLYVMTVTPSDISAISSMGSSLAMEYWPTYTLSTSFAAGDLQTIYGITANAGLTYIAYSDVTNNSVKVYTRSTNSPALQQSLTPSGYPSQGIYPLKFGCVIKSNTNFDLLAIVAGGDNLPAESSVVEHGAVYVFRRSGSTWTQENRLINSNTDGNYYYQYVELSPDGNTLVTSPTSNTVTNGNKMDFYNYRGGYWYLDSTITIPEQREILGFSNDNTYFFLASPYTTASGIAGAGSIYVYKRTGDTWAQDSIIYPTTPVLNGNFGGIGSRKRADGTFAFGQSNNVTEIYTFTAGSWTNTSTLAYTGPGKEESTSSDGTYYVSGDSVYKLAATGYSRLVYIGDNSIVQTSSPGDYRSLISSDGQLILQVNYITAGTPEFYQYTTGDPNRVSFNSTTKVLTLTETKSKLNTMIDAITLTPETDYTGDFVLTYSVTTPTSATDSRVQDVDHTS